MRGFRRRFGLRIYRFPKRFFKRLFFFSLLTCLVLLGIFKGFTYDKPFTFASVKTIGFVNVADNNLQGILDSSIPMLAVSQKNRDPNFKDKMLTGALYLLTGFELGKPFTFLQAEIPYLRYQKFEVATADDEVERALEKRENIEPKQSQKEPIKEEAVEETVYAGAPLVGIYHTHTGETYQLTDKDVRLKGQRGGVFAVGEELKKALEQQGIGVIHSDAIHDYDYREVFPYSASEKTASNMLVKSPTIEILIDLHRDAVEGMTKDKAVVEINGENYATMFFVVGSNKRENHPNWSENYDFALRVSEKIKEMYPGLLRKAPQVKEGRYNQHLHPRALLIEIGEAYQNTTEESIRTARLFANVLSEVLQEIENE